MMKKFILYFAALGLGVLANYLVSKAIDPATNFYDVVRSSVITFLILLWMLNSKWFKSMVSQRKHSQKH